MLDALHAQSSRVPHGTPCPAWHKAQVGLVILATFGPKFYFPDACDNPFFVPMGLSLLLPFFLHLRKLHHGSGKHLTELELLCWSC